MYYDKSAALSSIKELLLLCAEVAVYSSKNCPLRVFPVDLSINGHHLATVTTNIQAIILKVHSWFSLTYFDTYSSTHID